ncbi:MAG: YdcF family protein [Candidatus Saccharibacteria bacterium]|nr:YdcF family protein [Candidatus Saccharibacteria bacterium]
MIRTLTAIVLLVITIGLIGVYLAPDDLQRCGTTPDATAELGVCRKADAIVAVSGGDTDARTQEAIELYHRGWASTVVFSGAAADTSGPSNAEAMRRYAIARGVPESAILVEGSSKTTRENAQLSRELFVKNKLTRVILVTSAYHQRRASIEFRAVAGDAVTVINHPVAKDRQWSYWWWATPSGWWLAMSEIGKILLVYIGASR